MVRDGTMQAPGRCAFILSCSRENIHICTLYQSRLQAGTSSWGQQLPVQMIFSDMHVAPLITDQSCSRIKVLTRRSTS